MQYIEDQEDDVYKYVEINSRNYRNYENLLTKYIGENLEYRKFCWSKYWLIGKFMGLRESQANPFLIDIQGNGICKAVAKIRIERNTITRE